ncbi:hypothetical protein MUK42_27416 [Musa troglodytarum]|uniref:Uncharacterized protein n=1 Tax=Musa troglodytarum TaxID=320322 RepID=A0A9E7FBA8_9LILI|nr:hypothetical protein MUK42_27416 [Musa troglodytarum]URD91033.1 hypothetical protein MUK42_27416 [Musa troglodytarum]
MDKLFAALSVCIRWPSPPSCSHKTAHGFPEYRTTYVQVIYQRFTRLQESNTLMGVFVSHKQLMSLE